MPKLGDLVRQRAELQRQLESEIRQAKRKRTLELQLIVTRPRQQIVDLDRIPFPDRTLIDYTKYHQSIGLGPFRHTVSIQATRGCPYHCMYCHRLWPKTCAVRSAENIFEEIKQCYDAGVKRFVFVDDIFNLHTEIGLQLFRLISQQHLKLQLCFSNGLRGDILTRDYIDQMVEAGTVNIDLALESASTRIQKQVRKNLRIDVFRDNIEYIATKYPHVILEMELMIGFPTETEEEAYQTLEFLKSIRWIHFPNLNLVKIYPNTDLYDFAIVSGISVEKIMRSAKLMYHDVPDTLPFPARTAHAIQGALVSDYFLLKERLLSVLPAQLSLWTEDECVEKYDSYLPGHVASYCDLLAQLNLSDAELGGRRPLEHDLATAPDFNKNMSLKKSSMANVTEAGALQILFLDLSRFFTEESRGLRYNVLSEPLGLMYLLTFLKERFTSRVAGRIYKSSVDFDSYEELKKLVIGCECDLICTRTLSTYRDFFHETIARIRQWGFRGAIISGGPYATSQYREMLMDENVNLAVLGEGELTIAELVERMMRRASAFRWSAATGAPKTSPSAGMDQPSESQRRHQYS